MRLHDLRAPAGANKKRRRIGRGESSGWGKTSGRGMNGQGQRSGTGKPALGFEGGQTPMYRRLPKRGFVNNFAKSYAQINVDALGSFFDDGATIDLEVLRGRGLAKNGHVGVRVLGRGELTKKMVVVADHVSGSARAKIEAAGGSITIIGAVVDGDTAVAVE